MKTVNQLSHFSLFALVIAFTIFDSFNLHAKDYSDDIQSQYNLYLSTKNKREAKDYINELIQDDVNDTLFKANESQKASIAVSIEFDDTKFRDDAVLHYQNESSNLEIRQAKLDSLNQKMLSQLAFIERPDNGNTPLEDTPLESVELPVMPERFGNLNIDMESRSISKVIEEEFRRNLELDTYLKEHRPVSLQIQTHNADSQMPSEFHYDVMKYVKTISIAVAINNAAPIGLEELVEYSLRDHLEIKRLFENQDSLYIQIDRKVLTPTNISEIGTWTRKLMSSEGSNVGSILSALLLGVITLIGFTFLVRSISKASKMRSKINVKLPNKDLSILITPEGVKGATQADFEDDEEQKKANPDELRIRLTNILQCTSHTQILNIMPILSDDEITLIAFFMSLERSQHLIHSLELRGVWDSVRDLDINSEATTGLMLTLIDKLETIRGTETSEPGSMFDEIALRLIDVAATQDHEALNKIFDGRAKALLQTAMDEKISIQDHSDNLVADEIEIKEDVSVDNAS